MILCFKNRKGFLQQTSKFQILVIFLQNEAIRLLIEFLYFAVTARAMR